MIENIFKSEKVNEMSSVLSAVFYQCWDEFEPSARDVVKKLNADLTAEGKSIFIEAIQEIFFHIEQKSEIKDMIFKIGSNYDPTDDSISFLEWLIVIKLYLKTGNETLLNTIYG